jgi:hypothetical protein
MVDQDENCSGVKKSVSKSPCFRVAEDEGVGNVPQEVINRGSVSVT